MPRREGAARAARVRLEPDDAGGFWSERDYTLGARNLAKRDGREIPVLVVGGWRDYNVKHSESTAGTRRCRPTATGPGGEGVPQKMLVIDQVSHGLPVHDGSRAGELLHAWFDRYLLGHRTNVEAQPAALSVTQDGVLHAESAWPPRGTRPLRLFLRPMGRLTTETPAADAGEVLGSYFDVPVMTESLALALRGMENAPMRWFETEPLQSPLRIAGRPRLELFAEQLRGLDPLHPGAVRPGTARGPGVRAVRLPAPPGRVRDLPRLPERPVPRRRAGRGGPHSR